MVKLYSALTQSRTCTNERHTMPVMTETQTAIVRKLVDELMKLKKELKKHGTTERIVDLSEFTLQQIQGSRSWIRSTLVEHQRTAVSLADQSPRLVQ